VYGAVEVGSTMTQKAPCLLATYWTLAGPIRPLAESEVSPWPLAERVGAAAEAGFRGVGFSHEDLMAWKARIGFDGIAKILEQHDMRYLEFEPLYDWWTEGERRRQSNAVRVDLLRAIEEISMPSSYIKCTPELQGGVWPKETYAEAVAELAAEARQVGARVGLETLPFSDLRTPEDGLDVLKMAGCSNVGLVLDIWHIVRGDVPFDRVAVIPGEQIVHIELNDAESEPVGSLAQDTLDHRLLPGDGSFDIPGFLDAVAATGYNGVYGVEILSDEQRQRPLGEAARLAHDTAVAQFR
jgi:sugar phosphate isomerase/epimerase